MKSTVLVLPVFAALFCTVFLFLGIFTSVYHWIETSHAVEQLGFGVLVPHVLEALPPITVVSAIFSLFLLLFSFRKKDRVGFSVSAVTWAAAVLLYGGLFMALSNAGTAEDADYISSPFEAQRIYPVGDYLFYGEKAEYIPNSGIEGSKELLQPSFSPVVIISPLVYGDSSVRGVEDQRILSLYRQGRVDDYAGEFILSDPVFPDNTEGENKEKEEEAALEIPLYSKSSSVLVFNNPPSIVSSIAREAVIVSQSLGNILEDSTVFYAAAVCIHALFAVMSILFIRTIPWPLLSALLVLLFVRGFFFLHRLAESEIAKELMGGIPIEGMDAFAPAAVLLLLSLLFLLWNTGFYFGKKEQS